MCQYESPASHGFVTDGPTYLSRIATDSNVVMNLSVLSAVSNKLFMFWVLRCPSVTNTCIHVHTLHSFTHFTYPHTHDFLLIYVRTNSFYFKDLSHDIQHIQHIHLHTPTYLHTQALTFVCLCIATTVSSVWVNLVISPLSGSHCLSLAAGSSTIRGRLRICTDLPP